MTSLTKCPCGNTAANGHDLCGRCQDAFDDKINLESHLGRCETLDDLKWFIESEILPRLGPKS